MRILITNDDGVHAPGIRALAQSLAKKHQVCVVAPDRERSGVGHGFTYLSPLFVKEYHMDGISAYGVSGKPVDCVKLGLHALIRGADMVVSGINSGANLGSDVLYSGTASAAMAAVAMNVPAIAISTADLEFSPKHFETAADYALGAVEYLKENPLPTRTLLNINVPDLPKERVKGVVVARLGQVCYDNYYEERHNPRGRRYFWLDDKRCDSQERDTDVFLCDDGYITLTPVSIDMTDFAALEAMARQQYPKE